MLDLDKIGEGGALSSRCPRRDDDPLEETTDLDTLDEEERLGGMEREGDEFAEYGTTIC